MILCFVSLVNCNTSSSKYDYLFSFPEVWWPRPYLELPCLLSALAHGLFFIFSG